MAFGFPEKAAMKQKARERLDAEGRFAGEGMYCSVRAQLIHGGIDPKLAWRIALYPFDPLDGSPAELIADPMYAEIAANWKNGKYHRKDGTPIQFPAFKKMPCGMTDFSQFEEMEPESAELVKQIVKDVKKAPRSFEEKWHDLVLKVADKRSDEATDARWVMANYLRAVDPATIDPEDVPSASALSLLYWARASVGNFGDFIKSIHVKLMPDKKSIEYESKFNDDGRDLEAAFSEIHKSFEEVETDVDEEDDGREINPADGLEYTDESIDDDEELEGEDAA